MKRATSTLDRTSDRPYLLADIPKTPGQPTAPAAERIDLVIGPITGIRGP